MQIKDYPLITSLADDDLILVETASDNAFKSVKASTLKTYCGVATTSSGSSGGSFNYVYNGDANGLFYYLGTNKGITAWSSPAGNTLIVTASSVGYGDPYYLVNRSGDKFWTNSQTNSWVQFHIGSGKLNCNYYSIKSRTNDDGHFPRTWKLQGSNDQSNWSDLDTQINNQTLVSAGQWLSLPVTVSGSFSSFRLLQNGQNSSSYDYLCLDEVELYGVYTPPT